MNAQNDETVTRYLLHHHQGATNGDQPTVHKESQLVPGIKIESFSEHNDIFRGNHAKKLNNVLNKARR